MTSEPDILTDIDLELAHPVMRYTGLAEVEADLLLRARKEIVDLRTSVIAFGALWATRRAQDFGLPPGHLHPTHYDMLARAGARMDDFTRGEESRECERLQAEADAKERVQ